jgi:hypothetical protein
MMVAKNGLAFLIGAIILIAAVPAQSADAAAPVPGMGVRAEGEMQVWHKVTISR